MIQAIGNKLTVLDFGELVLVVTRDGKLIVAPKKSDKHLTINVGGRSGILDVHVTTQGVTSVHESLGGLRSADLASIFEAVVDDLKPELPSIVRRVIRRVRFGWLRHHGILVFPFLFEEEQLLGLGTVQGRRWTAVEGLFAERLAQPLSRDQVERSSANAFLLYKRGARDETPYGALFKLPMDDGTFRFCWFRSGVVICELVNLWRRYEPVVRPRLIAGKSVEEAIAEALANTP